MRPVPEQAFHGLIVLDKPLGVTSRKALNILRRRLPRRTKIGHTGTLDPLATGVLVVCLGSATRLAEYVQTMPKTYRAGVLLGARSDTDDTEGNITPTQATREPGREEVTKALKQFLGDIAQTPPAFSAAMVAGQRAYHLARRGQEVELASRRVQVYRIETLSYCYPHLELEIDCGKGTYIRSLARDLGDLLGCGGLIEALRRTAVGPFSVQDAISPDADIETVRERLLHGALALSNLPKFVLPDKEADDLAHGRAVDVASIQWTAQEGPMAAFKADGSLVGVVRVDPKAAQLRAEKILI
jgi:tRNA pseudouridine55 synthase